MSFLFITKEEGMKLHTRVGKIDKNLFKCISNDIVTEDVIITDNQMIHIYERHPEVFNALLEQIKECILDPDYIIEDKHENTGLVIKRIKCENNHMLLVLKICTSKENIEYKNSIISSWKISEKRLKNYLRNKRILYKKEEIL